jgi:hypothetical protein
MATRHGHRSPIGQVCGCAAALVVTGALLAGCGGHSSSPPRSVSTAAALPTHTQPAQATPRLSNPDIRGASKQASSSGHAKATTHRAPAKANTSTPSESGVTAAPTAHPKHTASVRTAAPRIVKARPTPRLNEDEQVPVLGPNPCSLVSTSSVESVVGGHIVERSEAPLGPTCIYRLAGSHPNVTLAIEDLEYPQVTSPMKHRTAVDVSGHRAYCGTLGTHMLFLPLSGGKVLNVTAPCGVAQRLAALALPRLQA